MKPSESPSARRLRLLKADLRRQPKLASKPQPIVDAAREADLAMLKLLVRSGADVNATWRNYRPLHALMQEKPHNDANGPSAARPSTGCWPTAPTPSSSGRGLRHVR